jgi:hypothetical protein
MRVAGARRLIVVPVVVASAACGAVVGSGAGDSGVPAKDGAAKDAAADRAIGSDASVGAPCSADAACPVLCDGVPDAPLEPCGPLCLNDPHFKGGYCSLRITECPAPPETPDAEVGFAPCPPGSFCAGVPEGDLCLAACTNDSHCRTSQGYKCCPNLTNYGVSVCAPSSLCE